jgi:hypothetical protein
VVNFAQKDTAAGGRKNHDKASGERFLKCGAAQINFQ